MAEEAQGLQPGMLEGHDVVAIRSRPGCGRQRLHRDYSPVGMMDDMHWPFGGVATAAEADLVALPLSVVVAVEDGTRVVVVPGSHVYSREDLAESPLQVDLPCVEETLAPGHALIFLGSLLHAGAAYPERQNTRLHFYVERATVRGMPARTSARLSTVRQGLARTVYFWGEPEQRSSV